LREVGIRARLVWIGHSYPTPLNHDSRRHGSLHSSHHSLVWSPTVALHARAQLPLVHLSTIQGTKKALVTTSRGQSHEGLETAERSGEDGGHRSPPQPTSN